MHKNELLKTDYLQAFHHIQPFEYETDCCLQMRVNRDDAMIEALVNHIMVGAKNAKYPSSVMPMKPLGSAQYIEPALPKKI